MGDALENAAIEDLNVPLAYTSGAGYWTLSPAGSGRPADRKAAELAGQRIIETVRYMSAESIFSKGDPEAAARAARSVDQALSMEAGRITRISRDGRILAEGHPHLAMIDDAISLTIDGLPGEFIQDGDYFYLSSILNPPMLLADEDGPARVVKPGELKGVYRINAGGWIVGADAPLIHQLAMTIAGVKKGSDDAEGVVTFMHVIALATTAMGECLQRGMTPPGPGEDDSARPLIDALVAKAASSSAYQPKESEDCGRAEMHAYVERLLDHPEGIGLLLQDMADSSPARPPKIS